MPNEDDDRRNRAEQEDNRNLGSERSPNRESSELDAGEAENGLDRRMNHNSNKSSHEDFTRGSDAAPPVASPDGDVSAPPIAPIKGPGAPIQPRSAPVKQIQYI